MGIMLLLAFTGILSYSILQTNYYVSTQIKRVKFNRTFTLKPGETVQTEDRKLRFRLEAVGRTIDEGGEVEYADLQIRFGKYEQIITLSEKGDRTTIFGDYIIQLLNAESFGKTSCDLKISRKNNPKDPHIIP